MMKRYGQLATLVTLVVAVTTSGLPGSRSAHAATPGLIGGYATESGEGLVLHDLDGTQRPIVSEGESPSWSPDGARLVYVRQDSSDEGYGEPDLWTVNADGSAPVKVTSLGDAMSPAWSPDGGTIAFLGPVDDSSGFEASIWLVDASGNGVRQLKQPNGEPVYAFDVSWSPDGTQLAFNDATNSGVGIISADGEDYTLLPNTSGVLEVAWSPIGDRIAYSLAGVGGGDVVSIDVTGGDLRTLGFSYSVDWSPDGRYVGTVDVETGETVVDSSGNQLAGEPVWRPLRATRLSGQDRIETAAVIARQNHVLRTEPQHFVLATSGLFPDALSGGPLAAAGGGSLLLTGRDGLDPRTADALAQLLPRGRPVYLLGGEVALAPQVDAQVRALGYEPIRLAGLTRYETSLAVNKELDRVAPATQLVFATGTRFQEALLGGAAAAAFGGALILTEGPALPPVFDDYAEVREALPQTAIGGDAAAAAPDAEAIGGGDDYELSVNVARSFFDTPSRVLLASANDFPDALAGGALAAALDAPLLLTDSQILPGPVSEYLADDVAEAAAGVVLGGPVAVSQQVLVDGAAVLYKGPASYESLFPEGEPLGSPPVGPPSSAQPPDEQPPGEEPPSSEPPAAVTDYSVVYPDHWGPIRLGETVAQAQAAGADVQFDEATQEETWDLYGCGYAEVFDDGARIGDVLVERGPEGPVLGAVGQGGDSVIPSVGGVMVGMTESDLMGIAEAQGWVPHIAITEHYIPGGRTLTYSPPESPPHALGFNLFPDENGTPTVFGYAAGLDRPVQASLEEGCL